MLTGCVFLLTACSGLTASNKNKNLQLPAASVLLQQDCKSPVSIPDQELTQVQVEQYWARDRYELIKCSEKHRAVVTYYNKRDAALLAK